MYPYPRSGAEAQRTPCPKGSSQELPHVRGQGQRLRVPDCDGTGTAERSYPASEVRGGGREELPHAPKPEAKGGGGEEQPQDSGQGQWPGGPTPRPGSPGCMGTGRPRGAIPHWRSGRVAVRRYPSSKVRSNGCALLEQPWRDTPRPR